MFNCTINGLLLFLRIQWVGGDSVCFSMALSNNVATFPLVEMLNDVIVPV